MTGPRTRVMLEPRIGRRRAFGWLVAVDAQTDIARVEWDDGLVSGVNRGSLLIVPRYRVRFRWVNFKVGAPGYAAELLDQGAYLTRNDEGDWEPWLAVSGGRGADGMQRMIKQAHERWKARERAATSLRDAWGPFQGHAPRRNP